MNLNDLKEGKSVVIINPIMQLSSDCVPFIRNMILNSTLILDEN